MPRRYMDLLNALLSNTELLCTRLEQAEARTLEMCRETARNARHRAAEIVASGMFDQSGMTPTEDSHRDIMNIPFKDVAPEGLTLTPNRNK